MQKITVRNRLRALPADTGRVREVTNCRKLSCEIDSGGAPPGRDSEQFAFGKLRCSALLVGGRRMEPFIWALGLRGRRKGLVAIFRWKIERFGAVQPAPPTVHRTVGFYLSSPFPAIKNPDTRWVSGFFGTPEGTRTPDLLIRSQSLYPTELPAHGALVQRSNILAYSRRKSKGFFGKLKIIFYKTPLLRICTCFLPGIRL